MPNTNSIVLGIDFDGTCVSHEYPRVGRDCPDAVRVLKRLVEKGHRLVLNTMRSGFTLSDAVNWFSEREIPLYGINENPTQKQWTQSPKVYAHVYIDDAALGCPLTVDKSFSDRPFVNWNVVESMLEQRGVL